MNILWKRGPALNGLNQYREYPPRFRGLLVLFPAVVIMVGLLLLAAGSERTQAQGWAQILPPAEDAYVGSGGINRNSRAVPELTGGQDAPIVLTPADSVNPADSENGDVSAAPVGAWNNQVNVVPGAEPPAFAGAAEMAGGPTESNGEAASIGSFARWSKVEIQLLGPASQGMSDTANPFMIPVDVEFAGPGGTFVVPAFYDGDGNGGFDGNVWKVRFSPNATGTWTYTSQSSNELLNGYTDTFEVTEPTGCSAYTPGGLPVFRCVGRLESVGEHYLKFADGPYWLKGGANEPEDFLAPDQNFRFPSKEAAIDYLADKGVNSLYLMTHNVNGDRRNVWPWVGRDEDRAMANHEHFDVAKLAQWEQWFDYMQSRGLVIHLLFEDDSAWTGFHRALYYREIIARFGHYNGIYWNISEEFNENYGATQVKSFAQMVGDLDPYDHPITVHNEGSLSEWDPFVGDRRFGLTSFQVHVIPQNPAQSFYNTATEWFRKVENSGWTIPIGLDDIGLGSDPRDLTREILWSVYVGGANYEMLTWTNYTDFARHFEDMTRARGFIESLPFWEMRPSNRLVTSGTGYVLAQAGEAYAVYLPDGGNIGLDLSSHANNYSVKWFNPRDGSTQNIGPVVGGGDRYFSAPDSNDWTLLLRRSDGGGNAAPTVSSQWAATLVNTPLELTLSFTDPDGPGPYTVAILQQPVHGTLTGADHNRSYTPNPGYSGVDTFTWKVNDGLTDSDVVNVFITISQSVALLSDTFDRPNSALVGPGWVELEQAEANVSIVDNQLFFAQTSDVANHPQVTRAFSRVSAGLLQWDFNFDWARTGEEGTYGFLMQLGDSAGMSDASQNDGAGVNLIWTSINGSHQYLGYRVEGAIIPLQVVSGLAHISVSADLDARTYSVAVDGAVVGTGIPFDANVSLDTVRFFTDNVNELNFSGRTIDDLTVFSPEAAPSDNPPPQAQDQSVSTNQDVPLDLALAFTDAGGTGPNSFSIVTPPSNGILTGVGANLTYTPAADDNSSDRFTWRMNNGEADSNIATVSITIVQPTAVEPTAVQPTAVQSTDSSILLSDTFDRPNSALVGPGWVELEQTESNVSIANNRLFFAQTSDVANHPQVTRTFSRVSAGPLQWDFNFDWARTGEEGTYGFLMQLGDSAEMSDASQNDGAGVNLIWTSIDGVHQYLGYRVEGAIIPLQEVSGLAHISVSADLDTRTYSVAVNGAVVGTALPFDANVSLDTVRFFTDNVNELNLSGRTIDDLMVFSPEAAPPDNPPPAAPPANPPPAENILLSDTFDRSDNLVVGEGWVEVEQPGASVSIAANQLMFDDSSGAISRPLVRRSFSPVSTGILRWSFDFDWARTGDDTRYELWMQLGHSLDLVDPSDDANRFTGVGVNLRWGRFEGRDQLLVSRQNRSKGGPTELTTISGPAHVSVTVDLEARTYSVAVDGASVGTGLSFDDLLVRDLDTVRFSTSKLNETGFSGRSFDNLTVSHSGQ